MAQFDVYKNVRGGKFSLLLDVQTDLLARLATRVVVPMATVKQYGATPISRLNPIFKIQGARYVLVFQELAAIEANGLGEQVGTLAAHRAELVAALDLLLTGI
ncbi:MAG: CcdB family protein [Polyangiaceae bacterium]|nr:CcdB family protein [Polyangiaceae bacterium]